MHYRTIYNESSYKQTHNPFSSYTIFFLLLYSDKFHISSFMFFYKLCICFLDSIFVDQSICSIDSCQYIRSYFLRIDTKEIFISCPARTRMRTNNLRTINHPFFYSWMEYLLHQFMYGRIGRYLYSCGRNQSS